MSLRCRGYLMKARFWRDFPGGSMATRGRGRSRETGRLEGAVLKPKPALFRDCTGRQVDRGKATEPSPGLKGTT